MSLLKAIRLGFLSCCALTPFSASNADISLSCIESMKDRNVRFVTAKAAGGGYDQLTRLIAREFSTTTGARTQVANIVGGNGVLAVQDAERADDQSLTIAFFARERLIHLVESQQLIDLSDFNTLAIVSIEPEIWVARRGFDIRQALASPLVASASDTFEAAPRVGLAGLALGSTIRVVGGYAGSIESLAAVLRGEVDLVAVSLSSVIRSASSGDLEPVLVLSNSPIVEFPDLPYLAGDGGLTEQLSSESSEEIKADVMQMAEIAAQQSSSVRALFLSKRVSESTRSCTEEIVDQIVFSESFSRAAAEARRVISPVAAIEAAEILQLSFENALQHRDLLTEIYAEMMR